jgi:hypothetical protein
MKLIKPNELYAGLPQGWWLKNYWEYVYPLILRRATKTELPAPDENQAGPVMYAVGKYASAFDESQPVAGLDRETKNERYRMTQTQTIHKGFVLPFVKFIALESDGDGSSFAELRNVAQSLALDSNVEITFEVTAGGKKEGEQHIDAKNAMEYYCESYPIDLPSPLYGQPGYTGSQTNRAISSSFMAIFEPQEEGKYAIDVRASYIFRDREKSKNYGPLHDRYEIEVARP